MLFRNERLCQTKTNNMKQYIFVFLMFWFNLLYAPELSIPQVQKQILNQESVITPLEINKDSIDVIILTHYKMLDKFTKSDRRKVRKIADDLGIKTKWLYKIIRAESGGSTKAVNRQTNDPKDDSLRISKGRAVGLIQFIPSTAISLGTTTEKLYNMSVSEQLDFVHLYYKRSLKGKKHVKESTLYMSTFVPAMIGKHDSTIIETPHSNRKEIYKHNKRFDLNKDSVITIAEVNTFISLL
jgi:hypothetical protein